jgi:hypothetical protein
VLCQDAFVEAFPNDTVLNKTTIYHITMKFEGTGEISECLHSGEWWTLPAPFMNCISGFIVLYCIHIVCFIIIIIRNETSVAY